jgi:branched-chain amino acid transport system ATP-binding protein
VALLRTVGLTKMFGDFKAVDQVDFTVDAGEVLALVGSNGAGKTTLVNVITGYYKPDAGSIEFLGRDVTTQSINQRVSAGIARSFQLVNLFNQLSVHENVALSIFAREKKTRRFWQSSRRDASVRDEAHALLGQFALDGHSNSQAGALAEGERKLLDVAIAYALKPKVLFLDEPTSGISTREKGRIMDTVSAVVRSGHISAIIIEHDMDVVFRYSDRIVVMHEGRVLADGRPDEIRSNDQVAMMLIGAKFTN